MKPVAYLKKSVAVQEFLAEALFSKAFRSMFPKAPFETKRALVLNFLIGAETERFAAAPVYGPTGKGLLKSKGVEGLKAEKELEKELKSPDGSAIVREFIQRVVAVAC
jgi:hypothetical protein